MPHTYPDQKPHPIAIIGIILLWIALACLLWAYGYYQDPQRSRLSTCITEASERDRFQGTVREAWEVYADVCK